MLLTPGIYQPLQLAVAKVAADLDLFVIIDKSTAVSQSSEELAQATGAKPVLLGWSFSEECKLEVTDLVSPNSATIAIPCLGWPD